MTHLIFNIKVRLPADKASSSCKIQLLKSAKHFNQKSKFSFDCLIGQLINLCEVVINCPFYFARQINIFERLRFRPLIQNFWCTFKDSVKARYTSKIKTQKIMSLRL